MRARRRWPAAAIAAMLAVPASAGAAQKVGLLVIGNNAPPLDAGSDSSLPRLRFADDDAAAFFDLMVGTADTAHLLTVMDGETQALYPRLVARSSPPTLCRISRALNEMARAALRCRASVLVEYSIAGDRSSPPKFSEIM